MEAKSQLEFKRTRTAIYIRFNEEEYLQVQKMAHSRGQKLQQFIKTVILSDNVKQPLIANEASLKFLSELKRIGNNVNQIARKLNSGFRKDWHDSFENCTEDLEKLRLIFSKNVAS